MQMDERSQALSSFNGGRINQHTAHREKLSNCLLCTLAFTLLQTWAAHRPISWNSLSDKCTFRGLIQVWHARKQAGVFFHKLPHLYRPTQATQHKTSGCSTRTSRQKGGRREGAQRIRKKIRKKNVVSAPPPPKLQVNLRPAADRGGKWGIGQVGWGVCQLLHPVNHKVI